MSEKEIRGHWIKKDPRPLTRYCLTCKHYIGGGDFNLCCDLKYGLCYAHTPACEKYEEKLNDSGLL